MIEEFQGLIISCARTLEKNTASEIYYLLNDLMNLTSVKVDVVKELSGIVVANFKENSKEVLEKIESIYQENPVVLRFTLKIVPIQYRMRTTKENLVKLAGILEKEIGENEEWKIELRRRHSALTREEIIKTIAENIEKGKVKMKNPKKYVIVEVIGKWTYGGITKKPEFSIAKLKEKENGEEDQFTF